MIRIVYGRNCTYQISYHVVWCPKYRRRVLRGDIATRVGDLLEQICEDNKWIIFSKEIQPDHIHLFLSMSPAISLATMIKKLKGITARKLFMEFPYLKKELWGGSLWSPSYYVGTAGNVSAKTIQRYIEKTEHIKSRR